MVGIALRVGVRRGGLGDDVGADNVASRALDCTPNRGLGVTTVYVPGVGAADDVAELRRCGAPAVPVVSGQFTNRTYARVEGLQ